MTKRNTSCKLDGTCGTGIRNCRNWSWIIILLLWAVGLFAQESASYAVYLTTKENITERLSHPENFLSKRALERRVRQNIELRASDLPITPERLSALAQRTEKCGPASKWLNAVYLEATPEQILEVMDLPFVDKIEKIKGGLKAQEALPPSPTYGYSLSQVEQINLNFGPHLHSAHLGENMLIALLDAGFVGANEPGNFGIEPYVLTRNFVNGGTNVFQGSSHGWSVLSTMAVHLEGVYVGTAPKAAYMLVKTEDENSETPVEMFNWIAGAELADSAGADVINSSLGYYHFDNPDDNYDVSDLDGRTSIITLGAVAAARTGMLVVTSAGNEGGGSWDKLTFPSDADSILTVGSVNEYGIASAFSSRGYTTDGRIKPNVSTRGEGAVVYRSDGTLAYGNGTSFSSPIAAGAAASLWSAVPEATAQQIIKALEVSASHYLFPNERIGNGIPNFKFALDYLRNELGGNIAYVVYPNPFNDYLELFLPDGKAEDIELKLYDAHNNLVAQEKLLSKRFQATWAPGSHLPVGMYFLHINRSGQVQIHKLVKSLHP